MSIPSYQRMALFILGALLILLFTIRTGRFLLGYPSSSDPEEVARWVVEGNREPKVCYKMPSDLLPFLPVTLFPAMGPSLDSRKRLCVYEVAKLTKDPTICELLMPSEYGMSCIGAATNFPQQECTENGPKKLLCYIAEKNIQSFYDVPQIENCNEYKKYNNHQVIHWCYGERARQFGELEPCLADASKDAERDDCYYQRAMKLDDLRLDMCEDIRSNQLMQEDCTATVKAWLLYPQLRSKAQTPLMDS